MSTLTVAIALLILTALAYQLGLTRSRKVAAASPVMHSRPGYHGALTVLRAVVPAFVIYLLWLVFGHQIIQTLVLQSLPAEFLPQDELKQMVLMQRLENISVGFGVADDIAPFEQAAADYLRELTLMGQTMTAALMFTVAAFGLFMSWRTTTPETRARNKVERFISYALLSCSIVAILTTIGIVLSILGESIQFFRAINPSDFFFGTVWNPRFAVTEGDVQTGFGLLPLLVGTLMIAFIAMLVAIPVGLMTAIYLAEYASSRTRDIVKPVVEVLAGIPTIVYGVFALMTVGPALSYLGSLFGLDINATSALTAGIVMGMMIIPFISSLSDDIITQVPRSMREGSLAMGATKSETIIRVVLPAALPGIVGAFLLALSRAIGETMIVVLAAGNSPVLTANPFEAVTTITVSIVNQLFGDLDFTSPQSLVAFALGLTLFVITLGLNVVALGIVRKYREQYE